MNIRTYYSNRQYIRPDRFICEQVKPYNTLFVNDDPPASVEALPYSISKIPSTALDDKACANREFRWASKRTPIPVARVVTSSHVPPTIRVEAIDWRDSTIGRLIP